MAASGHGGHDEDHEADAAHDEVPDEAHDQTREGVLQPA